MRKRRGKLPAGSNTIEFRELRRFPETREDGTGCGP
jgi:hypothetical protein